MFAYCGNNPINRVDTSGETSTHSTFCPAGDGYYIRTTISTKKKSVTCTYKITYDGIIIFEFSKNPYKKVERYGFAKILASVMYQLAKRLDSRFLRGRTEKGIYREMTAHHVAYSVGYKRSNADPAHIGALYTGSLGYDSNAYRFE